MVDDDVARVDAADEWRVRVHLVILGIHLLQAFEAEFGVLAAFHKLDELVDGAVELAYDVLDGEHGS